MDQSTAPQYQPYDYASIARALRELYQLAGLPHETPLPEVVAALRQRLPAPPPLDLQASTSELLEHLAALEKQRGPITPARRQLEAELRRRGILLRPAAGV